MREQLRFFNGYGGFSEDGTEYVILLDRIQGVLRRPPQPWTNVIANERVGFITSESGAACTWSMNSRLNRLTPWFNDPVMDPHGEALYVRDEANGVFWSPTPGPVPGPGEYQVRHGFGYTEYHHSDRQLNEEIVTFVPRNDPVKITRLRVTNSGDGARELSVFSYAQLVLGVLPWETAPTVATTGADGVILATNVANGVFSPLVAFAATSCSAAAFEMHLTADRTAFLGHHGNADSPAALRSAAPLGGRTGVALDPCAAFQLSFTIQAGETIECVFLLGEGADEIEVATTVERYGSHSSTQAALDEVRAFWRELLSGVQIVTPSPEIDLMVNGWLAYQNLSCRIWGRSAFYQSGGAYGFRDQLQDTAALVYLAPERAREQIVLHASHQFVEGDVLHWWHPPTSAGIRTHFSDDLLWLPYATAFYIETTADASVLDASAHFLTARPLMPDEDEAFVIPEQCTPCGRVYEHCCRAIDLSLTAGSHGLPLMGTGDWNDGMNRVGREGCGESVWLGFFLSYVLDHFIPVCEQRGDDARATEYRAYASHLGSALNDAGWDGSWYRRAYYDDGTPLGTAAGDECRIDAIAQAWAVISAVAPPDRAAEALDALETQLVSETDGIIRLLTPAFDRTPHDPGYIKGYLPGVRENGGQYTHGALWAVQALAELGRCDRAAHLLEMLSPVTHARTPAEVAVYQVEPYVIAADVYGVEPHVGRGGWTWYTGSAGWMFRVALESVLGVQVLGGNTLTLRPCIPADWPGFTLRYRLPDRLTSYEIIVQRSDERRGTTCVTLDGVPVANSTVDGAAIIPLDPDGRLHSVQITLADHIAPRYTARREACAIDVIA